MIRWVAVIFMFLLVFPALFPELKRLGIWRAPGDVLFNIKKLTFCLPFGSTLIVSALAFLVAELLRLI